MGIARAIVGKPKLLLADEPTGNLHSSQGEMIMETLKALNDEGMTIIQVTHNEKFAGYGKRIIRLEDGIIRKDENLVPVKLAYIFENRKAALIRKCKENKCNLSLSQNFKAPATNITKPYTIGQRTDIFCVTIATLAGSFNSPGSPSKWKYGVFAISISICRAL